MSGRGVGKRRYAPGGLARCEKGVVSARRLEDEPAAHGKLRERRVLANLPADRLQTVRSGREPLDAVAVVVPAIREAAMRSSSDFLSVQKQDKALVGGDIQFKGLLA